MTTRWKRLKITGFALVVVIVGVLGWLTIDARNQLSDAKGRVTRVEAAAASTKKSDEERARVMFQLILGVSGHLKSLESQVNDVSLCVNELVSQAKGIRALHYCF